MPSRGKGHKCPSCHKTWVCFVEYCKLPDHVDCDECFIHKGRQKNVPKAPIPEAEPHPLSEK